MFRGSVRHAFHLPGTLRSPGITRLQRYYGSSDSCPVQSPRQVSLLHAPNLPVVPAPTTPCRPVRFEFAFCVQVQTTRAGSAPVPITNVVTTVALRLRTSLAGSPRQIGRIEFTCVPDQPFAFRCSPPRLAATQFRSATGSNSNLLARTCTSPIRCTHKRTSAALRAAKGLGRSRAILRVSTRRSQKVRRPRGSRIAGEGGHSPCPFAARSAALVRL